MSAFQFPTGSNGKSVFLSTVFARNVLRVALLGIAGLSAVPAHAAVFWLDDDPMRPRAIMVPEPDDAPRPHRARKARDPDKELGSKLEKLAKEHAKPVGPLVIAISIDRQTMHVYDANGLFAETRVSTGVSGHSTPMGVFSIIQKNKWHKSNIYSGAPMPYMQRITWSGIALHAGVVPGHPASHGCIRMPMAFATKLWSWTRMGARVVITPGDIAPTEISHPLLVANKPVPVAAAPASPPAAAKPADMKSGDLGLKPGSDTGSIKTVTADASNALVAPAKPILSDAPPATGEKPRVTRQDVDAAAGVIQPTASAAPKKDDTRPADAVAKPDAKAEIKAEAKPDVKPDVKPDAKPEAAKVDPVDVPPPADTSPRRSGQIAVLISGKDGKLYIRQNFSPLFETPITIKPADRPLGTHVFTARVDKDEAKSIHWSVVSLPAAPRRAAEDDAVSHRRKRPMVAAVMPQADSAAEALDRVTIPPEAMTEIADAIATGGSIIVSDQSIKAGGETGQGTEFVVPLR